MNYNEAVSYNASSLYNGVVSIPVVPPVVTETYSGGYFDIPSGRRRTKEELRAARERYGITEPVEAVIERVAEQQVIEPGDPEGELKRALARVDLAYRAFYAELLKREIRVLRQQNEEEEIALLLLM